MIDFTEDLAHADAILDRVRGLSAGAGALRDDLASERRWAEREAAARAVAEQRRWRAVAWTGRVSVAAAVAVFGFFAYQQWGTDAVQASHQEVLREEWDELRTDAIAVATNGPAVAVDPVLEGDAIARLQIPKIDTDQIVVDGIGGAALRRGPGRYPSTAPLGHAGNSAIAGHRTTYGAPFANLGELVEGDEIIVTTLEGRFRYVVSDVDIVQPEAMRVLRDHGDNRLTLTTCHPARSNRQRMVVTAMLDGDPVTPA